ncbi:hypothetical protein AC1031_013215 [Aphanomyces cochlioides]|nr:hypothetical protein AC1031_013215 [Aphanomyces cochlioides]
MVKQAIEDKKRHDADEIQNNRKCRILAANGSVLEKPWQQVEVGDILFLKDKDELPADILILATSEEEGRCFVETCNLDGETNLKRRTACEPVAKLIGFRALNDQVIDEQNHKEKCMSFKGSIEYEQPNNRLSGAYWSKQHYFARMQYSKLLVCVWHCLVCGEGN